MATVQQIQEAVAALAVAENATAGRVLAAVDALNVTVTDLTAKVNASAATPEELDAILASITEVSTAINNLLSAPVAA